MTPEQQHKTAAHNAALNAVSSLDVIGRVELANKIALGAFDVGAVFALRNLARNATMQADALMREAYERDCG